MDTQTTVVETGAELMVWIADHPARHADTGDGSCSCGWTSLYPPGDEHHVTHARHSSSALIRDIGDVIPSDFYLATAKEGPDGAAVPTGDVYAVPWRAKLRQVEADCTCGAYGKAPHGYGREDTADTYPPGKGMPFARITFTALDTDGPEPFTTGPRPIWLGLRPGRGFTLYVAQPYPEDISDDTDAALAYDALEGDLGELRDRIQDMGRVRVDCWTDPSQGVDHIPDGRRAWTTFHDMSVTPFGSWQIGTHPYLPDMFAVGFADFTLTPGRKGETHTSRYTTLPLPEPTLTLPDPAA